MATAAGMPNAPFRSLLVTTDFGEDARRATVVALQLARHLSAHVTLVHVHHVEIFAYAVGLDFPYEQLREAARAALRQATVEAREIYPRVESLFLEGEVREGILQSIERVKPDLLVTGTHGRGGLARALMGSVAESLLRRSPVPVLTVSARTEPSGAH